jgi:hypothetical protein
MTTKKERAEALARMTKAELVKTILALDKRQTQLLNELAFEKEKLEATQAVAGGLMKIAQDKPPKPDPKRETRVMPSEILRDSTMQYTADPYSHAGNSQPEHVTPAPPAFPWSSAEGS